MHFHGLANSILSLDMWQGAAAYRKVLGDHTEVEVPTFEVTYTASTEMLEGKCCDVVR